MLVLSNSYPAVATPVITDYQSTPLEPATIELQNGAAVRSIELLGDLAI